MVISEISIRRPVLATVMSLVIVLLGVIAWNRLPLREYPNIDEPIVTVETTFTGASADIMESQVTQPLEESLAGIEGIEYMSSISRAERSQITVRFKVDRDPDGAANDVRDRVARVRNLLPDEIDEPVIAKVEADAQPIIYMAFSSDRASPLEVTDYADRFVKDRLQNLPGVADVRIFGERKYSMRIWLDAQRLAAYNLTPQDVETALRRQNVEIPAGRVESFQREFTVVSETDLQTPEQFAAIIIKESEAYPVRLGEVAKIELAPENERVNVRFNGRNAVALGIVKQAVANPLEISDALRAELPRIQETLPEGMSLDIAYDTGVFIDRSIKAVFTTIGEAVLLVVLVIFVFLRSIRATLIPLVTIPVSLIGTLALMYVFGFSINTLTLLAMVLAIGLVVDDAIVMLENIYRHVEEGMPPLQAAMQGSREIGFAVVAMTLTLAAVYAPMAFTSGRTGRLFIEFALALAGSVLVSGFVALTLSPMMCSKLLRHQERHNIAYRILERGFVGMTDGYRWLLRQSLNAKGLVVLAWVLVLGLGIAMFRSLPSELSPVEDRGVIVGFGLGPEGATIEYTDRYAKNIEQLYQTVPEMQQYFTVVGFPMVNNALSFIRLKDWEERERPQQAITGELAPKMFGGVPGLLAFAGNPPSLGQSPVDKPINFVIQTTGPYSELQQMVDALLAEARKFPGMVNVDSDLKLNKPELKIDLDRDKVANVGLSVDNVGRTLETMLGGRQVTRFKRNGKQYDVIVQVADVDRRNPDDLSSIYVRNDSGEMIPLSAVITVQERVAPKELNHFNKLRSATITAFLVPGVTQGAALAFLEDAAARVLPASATIDYTGESREYKNTANSFYFTFFLAIGFIYLVLAAQFESFRDPVVIVLSVAPSFAGAMLALKLTGGTWNIYSQIGMVTLVGLITKHGILIVEFANQLREQGKAQLDAVVEAATLRLRPILMTTGAMVFGAVPLALAHGAGAESRIQIGWVIVGGMTVGTLLTIFVVPTAYMLMSGKRHRPHWHLHLPGHGPKPAAAPPPAAPTATPAE
ncbi:MAG: efflux RND transporter permease subunit [Geminicoccaceae bacterium]